ncbi:PAS domain S-box-containing protein [Novosphingobium hassiacum]|uniref:histidine kinase n=1 Tax=Novosphingobium hassiacum TaxID=173676 RepID=A0A7W5ZVD5_9SPHN|nr:PAS domain-containing protein [Novosphingobium hassiacum]MBB3860067.1 PAS domain S-box-containing protein [Novosphingobium hassiacum]
MLKSANLSPESLSLVLEQSTDCVKLVGPDGGLLWMNPNGLCAMEIADFNPIKDTEWAMLWPEESRALIRDAMETAASGKVSRIEAFCPTAKGTPRWWEISVSPVKAPDGTAAGFISISRDVSQLHADREALQILLAEMRHRLKNSFAIVCSMLRTIARGHAENSAFADEMVARISALARAQTLFSDEREEADVSDLLSTLVSPFQDGGRQTVSLVCNDELAVSREHADVISLVIGELTVNSTKHGAIGMGGRIAVDSRTSGDSHVIRWQERSDTRVESTSRVGGQGLRLIDRICKARGATFAIDWVENGLDATLSLPIANDA